MKLIKLLTLALLMLAFNNADAQCVQKCINSSATAFVATDPTWTYNWTVSGGIVFTGQGTPTINIASVGSTVGTYTITCQITTAQCDSQIVGCIDVIETTPTLTLPLVCQTNGTVPVAGGSPSGGVYSLAGVPITDITSAMIGQTVTYAATSGGCSGTVTSVVIGSPMPNTTITIN